MKEVLLSIIIPVYNVEKYILPCLESIFKQGLKECEFEVILVDDGCTDNTMNIVSNFIKSHTNINLIRQSNQGPSIARNKGIQNANGKYVLFIDSDDLLITNSIKPMLELAVNEQLDILKAKVITIDNKDVQKGLYPQNAEWFSFDYEVICGEKAFISYYNPDESYSCMNLFRRALLCANGIIYPEGINFAEDVAFTIHAYLKAQRFIAIPYTHYIYRRNDTSIMSTMNINKLKGMNTIITYLHKIKNEAELSIDGNKKMNETMHACLSVNLWYLSHYTSLYPQRKEVIADLKKKCPNLSFNDNMKQRITTLFYKYMPSVYISFRYFTAKHKYNQ